MGLGSGKSGSCDLAFLLRSLGICDRPAAEAGTLAARCLSFRSANKYINKRMRLILPPPNLPATAPPPFPHQPAQQEQHRRGRELLPGSSYMLEQHVSDRLSVIYEASQPSPPPPRPPPPFLCSRDAGGVSLLKMLFHHLLDLRLSACIKGLHLDGESASPRRPVSVHPPTPTPTHPNPSDRRVLRIGQRPNPALPRFLFLEPLLQSGRLRPHPTPQPPTPPPEPAEREKSQILLRIDLIYVCKSQTA